MNISLKKRLIIASGALALCFFALFSSFVQAKTNLDTKDRYIVVLKDTEKDVAGTVKKMSSEYGIKTKYVYKRVLKGFSATISEEKLAKIRADKKVKYVAVDRMVSVDARKPKVTPPPKTTPTLTITPTPTNGPLSIRVISPNGGEVLERGQTYRITWEASSRIDSITLGYKGCDSCLDWIASDLPNNGYYDWTVNVGNTVNTQFKIYIMGYDTGVGSVTDVSDNNFTVQLSTTPTPTTIVQPTPTPTIWLTVKTPNGGEVWNVGETRTITWESDPRIDNVWIGYKACDSCLDWIVTGIPNTGSYDWKVATDYAVTQYRIYVNGGWTGYGSVTDLSDNVFTINKPTISPTATPMPTPMNQIVPSGVKRIGATPSESSAPGAGISIAVLDTGVYSSHADLNGVVLKSVDCLSGTCINGGLDDHGHGTHVAGTIAALNNTIGVVGVAPASKIVSVKILDKNGWGYWSQIIAGIEWVTTYASTYGIKVANMSLGGDGASDNNCGNTNNDPLHQAICASTASGITYVVAAGNESVDASTKTPASYNDTVITVSALVDTDGKPGGTGATSSYGNDDTFASFSNYGTVVDLGAPGVYIYSTLKNGSYGYMSGTSMATPHVAGVAARYLSIYPASTWQQVLNGLKNTAEPLNSGHTDPSGKHNEPIVLTTGL